jgi:flagellar biosynthesis/type III secretory pathway chaperone
MKTTTHSTEQLAALIAAKQQVLEILVQLSRRQTDFISSGDMTSLMKLLAGKQTVLGQLQKLDQDLAPFRGEDPERRVWRSTADRAACQARAERCNTLLAEAMALEQQAETTMQGRRDAAAATLSAVHTAAGARAAYATIPSPALTSLHVEG